MTLCHSVGGEIETLTVTEHVGKLEVPQELCHVWHTHWNRDYRREAPSELGRIVYTTKLSFCDHSAITAGCEICVWSFYVGFKVEALERDLPPCCPFETVQVSCSAISLSTINQYEYSLLFPLNLKKPSPAVPAVSHRRPAHKNGRLA